MSLQFVFIVVFLAIFFEDEEMTENFFFSKHEMFV